MEPLKPGEMAQRQEQRLEELDALVKRDHVRPETHSWVDRTAIEASHWGQALEWLQQVFQEQNWSWDVFALAIQIENRFLGLCPVQLSQFQLSLVASVLVAAKSQRYHPPINASTLIDYSANSITLPEVQAWELLVLSKLSWHINFVELSNYLDAFWRLIPHTPPSTRVEEVVEDSTQEANEGVQETLGNAKLLFGLCCRDRAFCQRYPFRVRALASLKLALTTCRSKASEGSDESRGILDAPTLWETLRVTGELVESCASQMDTILWALVPPASHPSTPAILTSTPKKRPSPHEPSAEVAASTTTENQENDDSAIGMHVGSPTPAHSSPGASTGSGSATSSPDSGTSMAPKRVGTLTDVTSLENILSSTQINPLAKSTLDEY